MKLILSAMVIGVLAGLACNQFLELATINEVGIYLGAIGDVFLRLIKMVIGPLVLATIISGVGQIGSEGNLARTGLRTMIWFFGASTVAMLVGWLAATVVKPGVGVVLTIANTSGQNINPVPALDLSGFISHVIPSSIAAALAGNEILQIVIFSVLAGVALLSLGERSRDAFQAMNTLSDMMLKMTNFVMKLAPLAVGAALAKTIALEGLAVFASYGWFLLTFYGGLIILWLLLIAALRVITGPSAWTLVQNIRGAIALAFSTASSEAAYPKTLEALEKSGVSRNISGFVLPLGYSFNLDGSMLYCVIGLLFLAQATGVDLSAWQQISLLGLLVLTSKGMAGVPRASIVVLAALLPSAGIPESALLIVLGIDQLLDMGRSATNVLGNAVASAVVARWDWAIGRPQDAIAT